MLPLLVHHYKARLNALHAPTANIAGLERQLLLSRIAKEDIIALHVLITSQNMLALLALGL
jgi:hypothetical protein